MRQGGTGVQPKWTEPSKRVVREDMEGGGPRTFSKYFLILICLLESINTSCFPNIGCGEITM